MKFVYIFFITIIISDIYAYSICDPSKCDNACRKQGHALGKCEENDVCGCYQTCNENECNANCKSNGNSFGKCNEGYICVCTRTKHIKKNCNGEIIDEYVD